MLVFPYSLCLGFRDRRPLNLRYTPIAAEAPKLQQEYLPSSPNAEPTQRKTHSIAMAPEECYRPIFGGLLKVWVKARRLPKGVWGGFGLLRDGTRRLAGILGCWAAGLGIHLLGRLGISKLYRDLMAKGLGVISWSPWLSWACSGFAAYVLGG